MQTTSKPAIPSNIEKIKRDWWSFRCQIRDLSKENNDLKAQLIMYEKAIILADGLLHELQSKRQDKELLESLKKRLSLSILYALREEKVISRNLQRERSGGGGIGIGKRSLGNSTIYI